MPSTPSTHETAARATAVAALLAQAPTALVAAVGDDGRFVAMPDSVPLTRHRLARARSALDLVQPRARETVIRTWERAKSDGAARAEVALAGDIGGTAWLHVFDTRETHGVLIAIVVPIDAMPVEIDRVAAIPPAPPRLVRTRKNDVAMLIDVEPAVTVLLGWEPDEMVGRRSLDFIHPDDHDTAINTWMEVLAAPGATCRSRIRHQHRDGHWVWLEISNRNLLDTEGWVDCEMFDIHEEMEAHEAVRASEQLLRRLAGALPVGVVHVDVDGRVRYANDRLRQIVGAAPDIVDDQGLFDGVVDRAALDAALAGVVAGADIDIDLELDDLGGGGRRSCTFALRALTGPDAEVTGAVGCLTDVTEAVRMRAELEHRATYDALTGCLNRPTVIARLERALAADPAGTAAVFIDLDEFKLVNDRYGHAAGDDLLVAIADRVRGAVRPGDAVGRLGGDELLVVCTDVANATAACDVAERIARAIEEPARIAGEVLGVTASIGVAWAGEWDAPLDADALIAHADAAMYTSKANRGGPPTVAAGNR